MTDFSDQINSYVTGARAQTIAGMDTQPEEAARIMSLSQSGGTPPSVIAGDPDGYEKNLKQSMAAGIVSSDAQLMAYVHSHPMAAAVSQNDWGNLSMLSQAAGQHAGILKTLNAPWDRGMDAAWDAAKEDWNAPVRSYSPQDVLNKYPGLQKYGFLGDVAATVGAFGGSAAGLGLDVPSNFASGAIHGASAFVNQFAKSVGMSDTAADSLTREVQSVLEYSMTAPELAMGEGLKAETKAQHDAIRQQSQVASSIYTVNKFGQAGKEVPKGVVPGLDALKAATNAQLLDRLDEVVKQAQGSQTKELAPELFKNFIEQHYGESNLSVSADAALGLYGEKLPEPDDGLLGWVPGIADKLDVARRTGADVDVPIADWVAHVDPALAKTLHDDLKTWPGGVTAKEALELGEAEPKAMVEDTLPQVRGAYGMEPMFSMGDRKLSLTQTDTSGEMHGLEFHDENGKYVGDITITPQGKNLEIENINGMAGHWANSFGPALIRDLARQLKALYPDAETVSGYRATGAGPGRTVTIKLDAGLDGLEKVRDLLSETYARQLAPGVTADIVPTHLYEANEKAMAAIVHEEVGKITGGKAKVVPSAGIDYKGLGRTTGVYVPKAGLIVYDLLGANPLATGRHEAVHFLKDQGLFSDKEWETLSTAVEQEGWKKLYKIDERYPKLTDEAKIEEAIADGFKHWAETKDGERREYSPVAQIFQKIMDLLDKVRARFKELFGHEPTADELFQKVSSGEIGQRASLGSAGGGPRFSMDELENLKASGLGLDSKTFVNLQKLYKDRYDRDLAKAQEKAERDQKKRQSAEWKDNRKSMREDVEQSIRQRPDIAVDQFLGAGQTSLGKQLPQKRYSLLESDLTPEQKKLLPSSYYSKSGFPVDEVAKQFGYPSGEAMVSHLGAYNSAKAGRSAREMLEHTINAETDRQMEAKYGDLPANILSEAKAQAFSDSEVHLITEEYQAAAQMAGVTAVDRAVIAQSARDSVNKMAFAGIKSDTFSELVKKAQDIAVRALANGDPGAAVIALQRRTEAAHIANEIKKVEKLVPKFQQRAKFYAKPWDPTKPSPVDPEWSLFTRNMLSKVGLPNGMSVQYMAQRIGASKYRDLGDFVEKTEDAPWNKVAGLELPIPDWMLKNDPQEKPFKSLTVEEWKDVNQSLTAFDKQGRDEQKAVTADQKVDKAELIGKMVGQLGKFFPGIAKDIKTRWEATQLAIHGYAALQNNATLMSRWDHRDGHGVFTETFTKPAMSAAGHASKLERDTGKALRELGPVKDGKRTLDSPYIDPLTKTKENPKGEPYKDFNRENLAVMISNMGNDYNWKVLNKGHSADPEMAWKWIEKNSTVEDLERALGQSKVFDNLWGETQAMLDRQYGMGAESVEPRPFEMHGRQWPGWYHPIIGDDLRSRYVNKLPDVEKAATNFWPSVSMNNIKRRTGAIQVLDLSYDKIPIRLSQEIHAIAYKEFVSNSAKIVKDDRFRRGVTAHYGKEYLDQVDQWLIDTAGNQSYNGDAMRLAQKASNHLRQAVVSTYIAFNLVTAGKHASTAFMMSARELDPNLFKSVPKFVGFTGEVLMNKMFRTAVHDLYGKSPEMGDKLWDWSSEVSEILQRRERNYQDTIGGAQGLNAGKLQWGDRIAQKGAALVAFSDLLSAKPLWIARYREEFAKTGEHGTSVREADLAVVRAHGDTAVTNSPMVARGGGLLGPWMVSLYGFMGTSMQRRFEIMHDMNDQYNLGLRHAITSADSKVPAILSSLATYVIWTGAVEEVASHIYFTDHRSMLDRTLGFLFGTVAQTIVGVRDLAYDLETGREDVGLVSSIPHDFSEWLRDLKDPIHKSPLDRQRIGKFVADTCAVIGDTFKGVCPKPAGKAMEAGINAFNGYRVPHDFGEAAKDIITGTTKSKVVR